jgi:septal ring factor EnvC (AmiA/AmiB activator)
MRNRGLTSAFRFTALILLIYAGAARSQPDEEDRTRTQLANLKQEMTALSGELKADLARRSQLRDALRRSEEAIGQIRREIGKTRAELARSEAQLADLNARRQELRVARGRQQERITREIQTAYQIGKQAQLRVLLNQEDPATLARAMTYYDYFYRARQDEIAQHLEIIARINVVEGEIRQTRAGLEETRKTLGNQQAELQQSQRRREVDLDKLTAGIKNKDQQLQKMGRDREELERLLQVIEQAVAEMEVPEEYQAFTNFKGEMPWPVSGTASNRFGSRRDSGNMRWQGLVIPADEGSEVNAIHHGRVVFADWFRGSGLLLIIDHGDGYMSLYAHNEALLRDVGEWVSAGSAVATVGNSGGQREPALYFEIRHEGKPTNPTGWLSR